MNLFGRNNNNNSNKAKTEKQARWFQPAEKKGVIERGTFEPSSTSISITGRPRLLFYGNDMECQFCHRFDDWTYLYTRKQIFVCVKCAKTLEAIMDNGY